MIEKIIPVNMLNKDFWNFLDDIKKAAKELNIEYFLVDNIAYCEGKAKDVGEFEILLEECHRKTIRGEKKRNIYHGGNDFNRKVMNWEDKDSVILLKFTMEDVDVILYKAKKQGLKFRLGNSRLDVRGNKSDVSVFSGWLKKFAKIRRKQTKDFKEFLENLKFEIMLEKIKNYSCDDLQKQDILKKASVLGIECIFDEDNKSILEISGRADKVRCFKSFLQAINPMFPKYLYPKYWDFNIEDAYAEIEVEPFSEEFREIKSKVCSSLGSANVARIKRIQNQGLMNNYLTMICSEKNEEERKLLFYGTKTQDPKKIYKYSKIGFDLSYASFKKKFGRSLYFPITAVYANKHAYESSPETFQILVADVLVGETLDFSENFENTSLQVYDSLSDRNFFYAIYKNSQSYPLYLVEYTLRVAFVEERKEEIKVEEKFECPVELSPQAWDRLMIQLEILDLTLVETKGGLIRYSGNEPNIEIFSRWLNKFFSKIIMGENNFEEILEKKNEKLPYSMLPYNIKPLEPMFPKYWDFSRVEPNVEIEVDLGSKEFEEISKIFTYGNENAQVIHLIRIQNSDLWNKYIHTIYSRTQVNSDKSGQRKLLFHGTRINDPKKISKNSEIGFDMKYAKNGGYGQGIYFSINSYYSHRYASTTKRGTFQILIGDAFTGNSFRQRREAYFDHLPEGHDSLFADEDNCFVLYKNFQSYPLYLVEYTLRGPVYQDPPIKQKHMIDILNEGQYCVVEYPAANLRQYLDSACLLRLEKEFKNVSRDEFIQDHFLIDQVEEPEWLVSFRGPRGTPYEGGLFKIRIIFPSNYPMGSPYIKFLTQIYHPSINENGRVCLGLLSQWTPATEIRHVLLTISCLLHDPEMEEPLMADRLALFKTIRKAYMKIAKDWTLKYAK